MSFQSSIDRHLEIFDGCFRFRVVVVIQAVEGMRHNLLVQISRQANDILVIGGLGFCIPGNMSVNLIFNLTSLAAGNLYPRPNGEIVNDEFGMEWIGLDFLVAAMSIGITLLEFVNGQRGNSRNLGDCSCCGNNIPQHMPQKKSTMRNVVPAANSIINVVVLGTVQHVLEIRKSRVGQLAVQPGDFCRQP